MAAKTCTSSGAKHSWTFQRNGMRRKSTGGPLGGFVQLSVVGVYTCACGERKLMRANVNAPGSGLGDYDENGKLIPKVAQVPA